MALVVGNLLTDPAANSFISREDAEAYLTDEAASSDTVAAWLLLGGDQQDASLIEASRWMAVSLPWCSPDLSDDELVLVGHTAARLAAQSYGTDLWGGEVLSGPAKRYKADTVEVEYFEAKKAGAKAGGKAYPWLYPMLRGLLCGFGSQRDVVRR